MNSGIMSHSAAIILTMESIAMQVSTVYDTRHNDLLVGDMAVSRLFMKLHGRQNMN